MKEDFFTEGLGEFPAATTSEAPNFPSRLKRLTAKKALNEQNRSYLSATELTDGTNLLPVPFVSYEDKVAAFLRRVLPVVSGNATHPVHVLVPWVCDVLQSKQSLEVYGQEIRDFTAHMQRFGVGPLEVKADHLKLYTPRLQEQWSYIEAISRKRQKSAERIVLVMSTG